jgi:asparagine synthase (glutamine-hydrolysing)
MCGIAGILRVHAPGAEIPPPQVAIPEPWLDILDDSIKHRGPDGQGRFRDRARRADGAVVDVALVHRRLAIIDPACGHQPMVSERAKEGEGLVAVVFNGCIYNHRELRKELQAAGREFVTDHSDTEVLIHGWREWGAELGSHLEGMFAAVIWDRVRATLVLLRDQFGEKPLEYIAFEHGKNSWVNVFGSSFAGLAAIGSIPEASAGQFRPTSVERWLRFGFDFAPPIDTASSIIPGSCQILSSFSWDVAWFGALRREYEVQSAGNADALLSAVDARLESAVQRRLEADVSVGCFLSGGVDSSLIAMYAKKAMGQLSTFTVRMPDDWYDESSWASKVAELVGTDHEVVDCQPQAEDLINLIHQLGLPFGDSSLLPLTWVSRFARQRVKVALSGDGGDELFLGYKRYWGAAVLDEYRAIGLIPRVFFVGAHPQSRRSQLGRMREASRGDGYIDLISIFPKGMLHKLLGHQPRMLEPDWAKRDIQGANWWDLQHYLPDDLMRKADTASMSCALEVREPFLDSRLSELCIEAHPDDLLLLGQRKGLLRQVARKYLPAEIVDRPKQGFAIPIGEWFRSDYGGMKQLLMDHLNSAEPWGPPSLGIDLNMKFVRRMLDEHMSGKRDHSQRLYMLLVLSIWAKWLGSLEGGGGA